MRSGLPDSESRLLIDEASFELADAQDLVVEEAIEVFNDLLSEVLSHGISVEKSPFCLEVEVRSGLFLYSLLYEQKCAIDVDALRRLSILLDRCAEWLDNVGEFSTVSEVQGNVVDSWSIGYAHAKAMHGRYVGCLSCSLAGRRGAQIVQIGQNQAEIFFLVDRSDIQLFWQRVLKLEQVEEWQFFQISTLAFSKLYFHRDLTFGKFEGNYGEVYAWVVDVLTVLNGYFGEAFEKRKGVRHEIQADIGAHGIEISPESVGTRGRADLMRLRKVTLDDLVEVKCEWHAKRLYNVDRIHFSVPGAAADDRIVIGIFTNHLPV